MQTENNPARYSEMSKPKNDADAQSDINAFFKDVKIAREKYKIADVHVIVRTIIERDGDDFPGMSSAHFGATQESEGMSRGHRQNRADGLLIIAKSLARN